MPIKKNTRTFPPAVKIYFGKGEKHLLEALKKDAKKYRLSVSALAFYALEAGLGFVEKHFDELNETREASK